MYVVTGGAGFIGSNIVAALEERGDDVIVVDALGSDDKWRNIAKRRLVDLLPPSSELDSVRGKVAGVIHMGAISSTTERDADLIVENNFRYSRYLWDWCAQNKVPFVYASSAATYGDGSLGFDDRDDSKHLAKLRPLNAYGWSKHLFDRWTCDRAKRGGATPPHWAGLKFFNVFGPNEFHKGGQRSVALQIFEQVARGEPVKLFASDHPKYPDGGQLRDFVWVGDCVDIALWFADGNRPSGLYNVGTGKASSVVDLANAVFIAMNKPPEIEFVPMPGVLKGRYQYFTQAEMKKIKAAGYSTEPTSLEEGVRHYVREYLAGGAGGLATR